MIITLTPAQDVYCVLSGAIVGFSLGIIGGGGSILAVPLLLYWVGISDPHVVVGTTALAVSLIAFFDLIPHARAGNVRWAPALRFAAAGITGALVGAQLGKAVNGKYLLILFAFLMFGVAAAMFRSRRHTPSALVPCQHRGYVYAYGGGVGILSGFFGIGGGFLIVPGLMRSAKLPILNAIASSLVAVGALGAATAMSYAWVGLVDWRVAAEYLVGGVIGGWLGEHSAARLGRHKGILNDIFVVVVALVASYMLWREIGS
ncbi:MAG: sulfite exporter TauE/SafE family protein [Phycisphaerae bacterium]